MSLQEPDKLLWEAMTNLINLSFVQLRAMALAAEGNEDMTVVVKHKLGTMRAMAAKMVEEANTIELVLDPDSGPPDLDRWMEGN